MLYCTVNVLEGKINHIYGSSTNKDICIAVADLICIGLNPGIKTSIFERPIERKVGLPMVISVDTNDESEMRKLVFVDSKYSIVQEYEYPMFA